MENLIHVSSEFRTSRSLSIPTSVSSPWPFSAQRSTSWCWPTSISTSWTTSRTFVTADPAGETPSGTTYLSTIASSRLAEPLTAKVTFGQFIRPASTTSNAGTFADERPREKYAVTWVWQSTKRTLRHHLRLHPCHRVWVTEWDCPCTGLLQPDFVPLPLNTSCILFIEEDLLHICPQFRLRPRQPLQPTLPPPLPTTTTTTIIIIRQSVLRQQSNDNSTLHRCSGITTFRRRQKELSPNV